MKKILLLILTALFSSPLFAAVWTIAIDPGHGGKDPGAIGRKLHIYEKNVTLSIAKELKALLDKDPNFRGVLTRSADYYISVSSRSEIARRNRANYLISIHADSSERSSSRGASVWVLSNRRANDEMGQWLEDHEKQSELLGGAGKVLAGSKEAYLNQTVLDLQFGHSQRAGYELGNSILNNFAKVTKLSRTRPQHASLGVLRSPDIPSVLVETGFLSNPEEEAKLSTLAYRKRIAYMIYQGLVDYRRLNGVFDMNTTVNDKDSKDRANLNTNETQVTIKDSGIRHKVVAGENLSKLAEKYKVKANDILLLNKLKRKQLWIGETLKIPDNGKSAVKNGDKSESKQKNSAKKGEDRTLYIQYKVKSGDRLDRIAKKHNSTVKQLVEINQLKTKELQIGQILKIPHSDQKTANEERKSNQETKTAQIKTVEKKQELPKYHVMEKGQTLYSVARLYNIPANQVLKLNPKLKDGKIYVGQKIQLKE